MLNDDIWLSIFDASSLEDCLSLGQVNRFLARLLKRRIKEKVLERAPWFELSDENPTWSDCARAVLWRTRNLTRLNHLEEAVQSCSSQVISVNPVDVTRDDELRQSMKPAFPDFNIETHSIGSQEGVIRGTRVMWYNREIDLTTMKTAHNNFDPREGVYYPADTKETVFTSAFSGLRIRHIDPTVAVEIKAENDKLLHVQWINKQDDYPVDEIIHKYTHPRDEHGVIVVDPETDIPKIRTCIVVEAVVANLMPGTGGALVIRQYKQDPRKSCLSYILPDEDLHEIRICGAPRQFKWHSDHFQDASQLFAIPHQGYVFVFICGKLFRLWIDLDTDEAKVFWDPEFPAIGPLDAALDYTAKWQLAQGKTERHLLTTRDGRGCVVGDLNTGKTYLVKRPTRHLTLETEVPYIPFATGSTTQPVGFYTFNSGIWESLAITDSRRTGLEDFSLYYRAYCSDPNVRIEEEEEEEQEELPNDKAEVELNELVGYMKNAAELYDARRDWQMNNWESDEEMDDD